MHNVQTISSKTLKERCEHSKHIKRKLNRIIKITYSEFSEQKSSFFFTSLHLPPSSEPTGTEPFTFCSMADEFPMLPFPFLFALVLAIVQRQISIFFWTITNGTHRICTESVTVAIIFSANPTTILAEQQRYWAWEIASISAQMFCSTPIDLQAHNS